VLKALSTDVTVFQT